MSVWMQKDGWKLLAEILSGAPYKLDGMYAECSKDGIVAGERSHEWYALHKDDVSVARLHISTAHVDNEGKIHFSAMMNAGDLPKVYMLVQCVTLVSLGKHGMLEDRLVCTMDLTQPIKLAGDAYIVLHAGMKLGDIK